MHMFNYIFQCIDSIWDVMSDVFIVQFYNYSLSLADFLVGLIVTGVILSIFLSFVNINNVRSSYTIAERHKYSKK